MGAKSRPLGIHCCTEKERNYALPYTLCQGLSQDFNRKFLEIYTTLGTWATIIILQKIYWEIWATIDL